MDTLLCVSKISVSLFSLQHCSVVRVSPHTILIKTSTELLSLQLLLSQMLASYYI